MSSLTIGLERLVTDERALVGDRRFAMLMNRASVDREIRLACDVVASAFPGQLRSVLSPQHGLWDDHRRTRTILQPNLPD